MFKLSSTFKILLAKKQDFTHRMYQYLKIERIATPCCLIPNTSYLKKCLKRGRKKKSINLVIAKLSRWFGFPTYSQCIAV